MSIFRGLAWSSVHASLPPQFSGGENGSVTTLFEIEN